MRIDSCGRIRGCIGALETLEIISYEEWEAAQGELSEMFLDLLGGEAGRD